MTCIKICGITNAEDAIKAVELGANMLGFIFAESKRRVDISTVKNICRIIGPDIKTVGVFVEETEEILRALDECGLSYIQLHGNQSEQMAQRIGCESVIRVARVKDAEDIENLKNYSCASFYLLDTYKKGLAGGTGEIFDWDLALLAHNLEKPFLLSGGLNTDNICDAIDKVKPFGVDISSGVESSPGIKDHNKLKELIENVRKADSAS
ncbi:MAG: phosphoribosylanthranilate isomerase [Armatimonadota bacterium]